MHIKRAFMKKQFILMSVISLLVNTSAFAQHSFTGLDLGLGFALQTVNTGSGWPTAVLLMRES